MAYTTGLVQRIYIDANAENACVFIGPTPASVELLFVPRRDTGPAHTSAFLTSMLDALGQALVSQHEVTVQHPENEGGIYSVELR
jgi:hypothetical protein